MLKVTEAACDRLLTKLRRRRADDDVAMRFLRKKNGWKLHPDRASPDDTVFSYEGRNVLLLDATVAVAMAAMTLDAHTTEAGTRLKLCRVAPSDE